MSNRIIPKEMLRGVRKADLRDISGPQATPGTRRVPERPTASAPPLDGTQLAAARADGNREGVETGRLEGQVQVAGERAALRELAAGLTQLIAEFEDGLANDMLSMSLELASLLVRQSLKVKPDLVLNVIREAMQSLPALDEPTTIYLHPADAQLLRGSGERDRVLAEPPWKIVEDARLERGGCRLETPTTEVDGTLQTRWRRIIAALGRDDAWIDVED